VAIMVYVPEGTLATVKPPLGAPEPGTAIEQMGETGGFTSTTEPEIAQLVSVAEKPDPLTVIVELTVAIEGLKEEMVAVDCVTVNGTLASSLSPPFVSTVREYVATVRGDSKAPGGTVKLALRMPPDIVHVVAQLTSMPATGATNWQVVSVE